MGKILLRGCDAVIVNQGAGENVLRQVDLLTDGAAIAAIGADLHSQPQAQGAEVIDASGWFVYPGLVNTHHHFSRPSSATVPIWTGPSFR